MRLNVTPEEFSDIQESAFVLSPIDFAVWMHRRFGCKFYEQYAVKVRYDVQHIPWFSKTVYRFEPGA